jgi:hypothetical protein
MLMMSMKGRIPKTTKGRIPSSQITLRFVLKEIFDVRKHHYPSWDASHQS